MPLELFFREFGCAGESREAGMIVLHGLLGSSRNWMTAGRQLGTRRGVVAPDLRNHGQSPHADEHTYSLMVEDVLAWMDARGIERAVMLGHSMGGKVAMKLACDWPERVTELVVVDIAPRRYDHDKKPVFDALNALPLSEIRSHKEADARLESSIPSWPLRRFLLTNLVRDDGGRFYWQANLPVLKRYREAVMDSPLAAEDRFEGDVLFVRGEKSDFVRDEDRETILAHFPAARLKTVPSSGHNPHIEQREAFVRIVETHLRFGRA